jgi:hypothetical protein
MPNRTGAALLLDLLGIITQRIGTCRTTFRSTGLLLLVSVGTLFFKEEMAQSLPAC